MLFNVLWLLMQQGNPGFDLSITNTLQDIGEFLQVSSFNLRLNYSLRDQIQDFFQISPLSAVRKDNAQSFLNANLHVDCVLLIDSTNTEKLSSSSN